jgi:hypothetical protein
MGWRQDTQHVFVGDRHGLSLLLCRDIRTRGSLQQRMHTVAIFPKTQFCLPLIYSLQVLMQHPVNEELGFTDRPLVRLYTPQPC